MSGTTLGLEHEKDIQRETCVLAKHAHVLSLQILDVNNTLNEWDNILKELTDMKTKFEDKFSTLDTRVSENKSVSCTGKVFS